MMCTRIDHPQISKCVGYEYGQEFVGYALHAVSLIVGVSCTLDIW